MEKVTDFNKLYGVTKDESDEKKELVLACNKCLDDITRLIICFMAKAERFPPHKNMSRTYRVGEKDIASWPVLIRKDGLFTLGCDGVLYNVIGSVFAEKYSVKKLKYDPDASVLSLVSKLKTLSAIRNALKNPDFGRVLPTLPEEIMEEDSKNMDDSFWKRFGKYAIGYFWISLILIAIAAFGIWLLYLNFYPHYNL